MVERMNDHRPMAHETLMRHVPYHKRLTAYVRPDTTMRDLSDGNMEDLGTSDNLVPFHCPKKMQNAPQGGSHGRGVKIDPIYRQVVYPCDRQNMQHEAFYLNDIYHLHGMMKYAK